MSDDTYTATLLDGETTETVELDLIAGSPQKSFIRPADVDGQSTDVVWELDVEADTPTYRIAEGSGYGESGTS